MRLGFIPGIAMDALVGDWHKTLFRLSEVGFSGIELHNSVLEKIDKSPAEAARSLAGHGFECVSWFANWGDFDSRLSETIDTASTLGCKFVVWGWAPVDDPPKMDEVLPVMCRAAEAVNAAGMRLLYHNHDHEFLCRRDEKNGFDWLMEQVDMSLLASELDIGWVAYGGRDIISTIHAHPKRFPILHLRDIRDLSARGEFIEVGEGILDLPEILQCAESVGATQWAIVEHTDPLAMPPVEGLLTAARNLAKRHLFKPGLPLADG